MRFSSSPSSYPHPVVPARHFARALPALFALILVAVVAGPRSLLAQLPAIKVLDDAALRPPAGARVAIIEFDDLECPTCAHYNPLLRQAAEHYKIPLVQHDFIIPYHNWSRAAAIKARWFDTRSKTLGDDFRAAVFSDQPNIYNQGTLNQFAAQFARQHGVDMPFSVDPQGKFNSEVTADTDLGKRTGVDATPTIFVVSSGPKGASYNQVLDPDRDLSRLINQALDGTGSH